MQQSIITIKNTANSGIKKGTKKGKNYKNHKREFVEIPIENPSTEDSFPLQTIA